jgi:hypothetical protein
MSVPGTDMRSIPDYEPIPALYDMESVEATGGEASDIQWEGVQDMEEVQQQIMALIQQIGPEVALQALQAAAQGGQEQGPPMGPPAGPQGALSGLQG